MKIKGQRISKKLSALVGVITAVTALGLAYGVDESILCCLDALLGAVYIISQGFVDGEKYREPITLNVIKDKSEEMESRER